MGAAAARRPRRSPFVWGLVARRGPRSFPVPGVAVGLPGTVSSDPLAEPRRKPLARAVPETPRRPSPPVVHPVRREEAAQRVGARARGAGGRKAGWSAPPPGAHTPPSRRRGPGRATRPSSREGDPGDPPPRRSRGCCHGWTSGGLGAAGASPEGRGRPALPSPARRRRRRCVYPFKKEPLER